MQTNRKAIELIKNAEGLRLKAYVCPAGVPTIGYGSTQYPDDKPVKMGDVVTTTEAEDLLRATLRTFEEGVIRLLKREVNINQFSALVSFAFNIGLGALEGSTLLRKVNANRWDPTIRAEFGRWVHGGGKVLPGLVSRRKAEADLYFKET